MVLHIPGRTPFVGRAAEASALRARIDELVSGGGGVALVAGEPGIGKTRLIEEVTRSIDGAGPQSHWGRCYDGDGAPALLPWIEVLRALARSDRPASEANAPGRGLNAGTLSQLLPELRPLLSTLSSGRALDDRATSGDESTLVDAAAARFRLFDSISSLLGDLAALRPLVLVLDDLHWADAQTVLLLEFMARSVQPGLLVIGAYRQVEVAQGHPLAHALGDLSRRSQVSRITLNGLDAAEVAQLAEVTLGGVVSKSLPAALFSDTEGNPLFVGELLRWIAAERRGPAGNADGVPEVIAGREAGKLVTLRLPETVREVIHRRLDTLGDVCVKALSIASLFGREFSVDVLERIGELRADDLLETLEAAEIAHFIEAVESAPGRYRFSHALVRDALYLDLPSMRRARLHGRAAEILEPVWGAIPERYAELSTHFFQAASSAAAAKAVTYAQMAAAQARNMLAYEEDMRCCELALRALELAAPGDHVRRCALLLDLARAANQAGDRTRGQEAVHRAAQISRGLGSARMLGEAAFVYEPGGGGVGHVDRDWIVLLEEALHALAGEDVNLRARLIAQLSRATVYADVTRSTLLAREAAALARASGSLDTLAFVLLHLLHVLVGPDDVGERPRVAAELVETAGRSGNHALLAQALDRQLLVSLECAQLAGAQAQLDAEIALAERLRLPDARWRALLWQGMRASLAGRFEEAERLSTLAAAAGQQANVDGAPQHYAMQIFILRREQGRMRELLPALEELVRGFPNIHAWRAALAVACIESDRMEEARSHFEVMAEHDFRDLPLDGAWLIAAVLLARTAAALGDGPRALLLYRLLHPYRDLAVPVSLLASTVHSCVAHELGLLAMTAACTQAGVTSQPPDVPDWWMQAGLHFERALELQSALGARPLLAQTQYEYARALLAQHATDCGAAAAPGSPPADRANLRSVGPCEHRERAGELLANALNTARELGMPRLLTQAGQRWQRGIAAPPESESQATGREQAPASPHETIGGPAPLPDGLTVREVEVLRLVAVGKSNREIADALVLTVNTVETHLRNIYAKIGVRGRTEAAAYAFRHGLAAGESRS